MLESLFGPSGAGLPAPFGTVAARLLLALALGWGVMLIYRFARAGEPRNRSFEATLVLLSVLIAMVTQVIGDSVARAFSLVGALSIVRFRTVVRDTQDTAYVIFAVVAGMAAGADHPGVALAGMVVIAGAALLLRQRKTPGIWPAGQNAELEIRTALGPLLDELSAKVFPLHLAHYELASLTTARQGVALEAVYHVRLKPETSPADLVRTLNKMEGVQNVALRGAAESVG